MPEITKEIVFLKCLRCSHEWLKRGDQKPKVCPSKYCHSVYWDSPRKNKRKVDAK